VRREGQWGSLRKEAEESRTQGYSCGLQAVLCPEMPLRKYLLFCCFFNKTVLQTFHSFKLSIKIPGIPLNRRVFWQ